MGLRPFLSKRSSSCGCPDAWTRTTRPYTSSTELAVALRRAAAAHGDHEKRIGRPDPNWSDWYIDDIVRQQAGQQLPS